MIGDNDWLEVNSEYLQDLLGEIAYMEDENIVFKCGSPSSCSQCARCSKC
jgi:hypothetical protein